MGSWVISPLQDARRAVQMYHGNLGFVDLLKTCSRSRNAEMGRRVHAEIADRGLLWSDPFLGSALVDMYVKCGLLEEAQGVFDMLPEPDVVTWTALIAGYAQHERGKESLQRLEQMQVEGVAPNAITYIAGLKACGCIKAAGKGKELHTMIDKTGLLESHHAMGSALVDMYAKCGLLDRAVEVFRDLGERDVVTWTALIGGYVLHDHGEEALDHFKQMQSMGVSPNAVTYVCGLKACAKVQSSKEGRKIHSDIERLGLIANQFVGNALIDMYAKCSLLDDAHDVLNKLPARDAVSWNALIAGYVESERNDEALLCFKQMQSENISPDMLTFASGLKACMSVGAMEIGAGMHAEIETNGLLNDDLVLGTALVDMYAKLGWLEKAEHVFVKLPVRDEITWTTLMVGFWQSGEIENVIRIFNEMMKEIKRPNPIVFLSMLGTCSHGGLINEGWKYMEAMWRDYGIMPTLEHHACMIDLLARAGQIDKAVAIIREAPFHPDKGVWLSILGACQKWGDTELGQQAFEELEHLDDKEAASYVFICNLYAGESPENMNTITHLSI